MGMAEYLLGMMIGYAVAKLDILETVAKKINLWLHHQG